MAEGDADRAPILPKVSYADAAAAVAWLTRVFGFVETFRMAAPDGTVHLAGLSTPGGGSLLVSGQPDLEPLRSRLPQLRAPVDVGWPNRSYSITVFVPDVERHHATAVAEGATVIQRLTDQPWGMRDYEAVDLDARVWNFSQVLEPVELEEWGAAPSG